MPTHIWSRKPFRVRLLDLARNTARSAGFGLTIQDALPDTDRNATQKRLEEMRQNPANVSFDDAIRVAEHYFGKGRQKRGSQLIFKTSWQDDPRVNLQKDGNKAKAYQVKQLLKAADRS